MREHNALILKSRYYLIHAKRQAKHENDKEVLALIKKCRKCNAAEKVMELKEKRQKENLKL